MKEAASRGSDLLLAASVFSIGSVAFLASRLRRHLGHGLSDLHHRDRAAVRSLPCVEPTQRFFDSWLSMLLNAVVLTGSPSSRSGLSAFIGKEMFMASRTAAASSANAQRPRRSDRYCVLMLVMAIICFQAPSLASALTGGAAVQQGVQMTQNAMMVAGLRAASTGRFGAAGKAAGAAANGGVIRAGAGLPHAAGQAVGAAGHAGARFAGTMTTGADAVVRQGYGYARTAAYKLAALRGRA
jgi:type IV secretion system protein VirB6